MNVHLLKIPGLLLATVGLHVAYTPPNPPASEESRQGVSSLADRMLRAIIKTRGIEFINTCFWCSALAESAVIVANAYPALPISNIILDNLLFGGDASQIRFTTMAAAGMALAIAGSTLRAWCYRELGKYFTFEMSVAKDHRLVTTGPYSIVRHPSYTGVVMTTTSIFLLHASKGSWVRESGLLYHMSGKIGAGIFAFIIAISPPALFLRMVAEDKALRKRFGNKWDAWAARVRYRIVPGIL